MLDTIAYNLWAKLKLQVDESGTGTYYFQTESDIRAMNQLEQAGFVQIVRQTKSAFEYRISTNS